jgi:hypothetical protein
MSMWRSRPLWIIVGAGVAIRLVVAFKAGVIGHAVLEEVAAKGVRSWDWHAVYASGGLSWTYPPLFLPWLAGASWLSDASGLRFSVLANLGPICADVGLALAMYVYLGWRGAGERARLGGAALVMLGPSFAAVSGFEGQIDSVAILPAVLGLMVWERRPTSGRAIEAGLLIGLGGAVKTVPLLLVLPLLGSARSWREGAKLVGAALVIPALALGPLWIDGVNLGSVIGYKGVPSWGGLSLVIDAGRGWHYLTVGYPDLTLHGADQALQDSARWMTLVALTIYTGFVFRYRPAPIDAAVLLWLVIYTFSPNFFLNYLIWGLPFFIMAGYLGEVTVLQAVLAVPTIAFYVRATSAAATVLGFAYVPILIALWGFWMVAIFALVVRIVRQRETNPSGIQPPLVRLAPRSPMAPI